MPIKWKALKVKEATDMIEAEVAKIKEPLEAIRVIAEEALKITNIPGYIEQDFRSVLSDVEMCIGGYSPYSKDFYPGHFDKDIERIRRDIPADSLKADERTAAYGTAQSLM